MIKHFKSFTKVALTLLFLLTCFSINNTSDVNALSIRDLGEGTYIGELGENETQSSAPEEYYFNTGTKCPSKSTYNRYNLLSVVRAGDIVFEDSKTGHIAIVEGIFTYNGKRYIRLIESMNKIGVVRSVLDDNRVKEKGSKIYRVITGKGSGISARKSVNINSVIDFCEDQLGKSYNKWFFGEKKASGSNKSWYCSELVWAAYKQAGLDICPNSRTVSPKTMVSNKLSKYIPISLNRKGK